MLILLNLNYFEITKITPNIEQSIDFGHIPVSSLPTWTPFPLPFPSLSLFFKKNGYLAVIRHTRCRMVCGWCIVSTSGDCKPFNAVRERSSQGYRIKNWAHKLTNSYTLNERKVKMAELWFIWFLKVYKQKLDLEGPLRFKVLH